MCTSSLKNEIGTRGKEWSQMRLNSSHMGMTVQSSWCGIKYTEIKDDGNSPDGLRDRQGDEVLNDGRGDGDVSILPKV